MWSRRSDGFPSKAAGLHAADVIRATVLQLDCCMKAVPVLASGSSSVQGVDGALAVFERTRNWLQDRTTPGCWDAFLASSLSTAILCRSFPASRAMDTTSVFRIASEHASTFITQTATLSTTSLTSASLLSSAQLLYAATLSSLQFVPPPTSSQPEDATHLQADRRNRQDLDLVQPARAAASEPDMNSSL